MKNINSNLNFEIKTIKNDLEEANKALGEALVKSNLLVNYPDLNYVAPNKIS